MKKINNSQKSIVLTGASGKIGNVLVKDLLSDGYRIIAIVNRDKSFDQLSGDFSNEVSCDQMTIMQSDLSSRKSRDELLTRLTDQNGSVYAIINNARSLDTLKLGEHGHIAESDFIAEFSLGVYAAYDLAWKLAKLKNSALKRVINISSIYGVVATNTRLYEDESKQLPLHYGVVKSAVVHLTKEMAVRLTDSQITVNAVSYGGVEGRVDEAFSKRYAQLCPQTSMLAHEDLSGSIKFLLSNEAKSITGHNLIVDGGWTLW